VYLLYYVCIAVFTLDAGLLARSQYLESPATGHLDTGFSWFPCVFKQILRWFPRFQVATTCFSRSPPDLNLSISKQFHILYTCKITTATGDSKTAVYYYYYYYYHHHHHHHHGCHTLLWRRAVTGQTFHCFPKISVSPIYTLNFFCLLLTE